MAAIDKMYLKDYYVFDNFRLWCIANKPTLLYHFYNWNMNEKEWNEWKENCYNNAKEINDKAHERFCSFEKLRKYYDEIIKSMKEEYSDYSITILDEQVRDEVKYHLDCRKELLDKETWIKNHELPITNFSCKEDKYLLWHCPIEEIRKYLIDQCSYKERWYYKLFFKK